MYSNLLIIVRPKNFEISKNGGNIRSFIYVLSITVVPILLSATAFSNPQYYPQDLDPETADWLARVDSSGGSVSDSVVSAVDDYVKEIKGQNELSLNIRNLILRENWYCGSFQAAFVPLFRNTNGGSGFSGAPADINRNYSEGEYAETGAQSGLKGNGINRYIETGVIPYQNSDLTLTDCRITVYSMSEGFETGRTGCRFDGVGFYLYPRYTNGNSYFNLNSTSESSTPVPSLLGYISSQRTNPQLNDVYYRNNLLTTIQNYSANYKPNIGFTVGAFNNGGTMNQFMNIRLGGYSIGKSLSPAQAAVHYNAVNRLMERLGRAMEGTAVPEIRSELFTFTGSALYANLRTRPGGFAQFEIQNSSGEPVEGFTFNDCPQITGDQFSHRVVWSGGSDVSQLVNTPVFLKVRLKNADLFTIQFRDQAEPIDSGAAGYKAGTAKQFFADTLLFRNSAGIIRMMHRAVKNPEPVLSPTAAWEGNYIITTYSNVGYSKSVEQDRMVYKMWLRCVNSYGRVPVYYESVDGINWTRPEVELFKFNGSAENNILSDAPYPGGLYTVVDDSAYNQTDSTRRFKSVYNTHPTSADSRLNVSFSYDGLVWIPYSGNPVRYIGEDLSSCGWNPTLGKYLGYFRDSLGIRKVGRYLSNDWINWTHTGTILKAEPYDIKGTQFYNMSVMYKDSVYWGIAGVLKLNSALDENPVNPTRTDNTVYLALLFSRDGINFTRCGNLTPLVNYGELGEWDDQMIYTVGIPVTVGNEFYIYYNGFNYKHYTNGGAPAPHGGVPKKSHIGLAKIGVDRFISLTSY